MNDNVIHLPRAGDVPTLEQVAGEAVDILIELVGGRVERGEPLSPRLLTWYLSNLRLSLSLAEGRGDLVLADTLRNEISTVRLRLSMAAH